jgi:fluoride exporter
MSFAVWVVIGSAAGGVFRLWVLRAVAARVGERFPWGTLVVNVSGAIAIGIVAAHALAGGWVQEPAAWHLAVVGLLGSYTTVSAFSIQTLALVLEGTPGRAAMNVVASVGLCLIGAFAGFALGHSLMALR